jgi:hypothetical protein
MDTPWRARLEPWPVAAFCAVTLFIWTNRIWLAWTNDEDTVAEKLVWSTPITVFVVVAAVLAVAMLRGADRSGPAFVVAVKAFAAGTTLFWAVRAPMISLADHDVPFKVVHAVLAVASVAAAVLAWRSVSAPSDGSA